MPGENTQIRHLQGGLAAVYRDVVILTANRTLTEQDAGKLFIADAVDLVITLPATLKGLEYLIAVGPNGVSVTTGHTITPQSADAIHGNGLTSVDGQSLRLAAVTDREGDFVSLIADGAEGWYITSVSGTWSKV